MAALAKTEIKTGGSLQAIKKSYGFVSRKLIGDCDARINY